jgi:hypothetical protein
MRSPIRLVATGTLDGNCVQVSAEYTPGTGWNRYDEKFFRRTSWTPSISWSMRNSAALAATFPADKRPR